MATPQGSPPSNQGEGASPAQTAKLGGVFWWLMLGLMLVSDIGSALANVLITTGLGLTATAVGAVVGVPLAVLGYALSVFLSFNAFMFSMGYYWYNKIPLMEARKLATWGVSAIIELSPLVNTLPTLTISFVVVTVLENAKRGKGLLGGTVGKVAQKALAATPAGRVAAVISTTTSGGKAGGGGTSGDSSKKSLPVIGAIKDAPGVPKSDAPYSSTPPKNSTAPARAETNEEKLKRLRQPEKQPSWMRDNSVDEAMKLRQERAAVAERLGMDKGSAAKKILDLEK